MIKVGELSGSLTNSLKQAVEYLDDTEALNKKIRSNFRDIYTNKMDNSVGEVVKMPRKLVNDNRHETCSAGLHFCSYDYLNFFGSSNSNKFKILTYKLRLNLGKVRGIKIEK